MQGHLAEQVVGRVRVQRRDGAARADPDVGRGEGPAQRVGRDGEQPLQRRVLVKEVVLRHVRHLRRDANPSC